jgi:Cu/Ag efflux pump CusA
LWYVDVATFGGPTREYQVRIDPDKLVSYGLSLSQVEQQLTNNNVNTGGSFLEAGLQQINVREVGLVRSVPDIEDTVLVTKGGTALRVKDIALVSQGPKIRLGQFARAIRREDGRILDNVDVFRRALTQVLQGEARYDLVMRYLPQYRDTKEAIENIRLLSPSGERVSLAQLCQIEQRDGASEIYREGNQRYIAVKYSVRNRDLGGAVEEAMKKVNTQVQLPRGYHIDWEGEYESAKRASARLSIIVPLTVLLIFIILYTMFRFLKWATLLLVNVMLAPLGGLLALLMTHTNFSVSSGVGFLALFGVSVQTGVIMLEYINQRRARGFTIEEAAIEGAVLRLRPIMMTMLVATLGLLPASLSHDIGSDSQRPFAIVIVGGLTVALLLSIYLLPTIYAWIARDQDVLPAIETENEA